MGRIRGYSMDYEKEINSLKTQLANLQRAFLQAQKNQVPVTAKTDDTANKVVLITPYTDSKMGYIGETKKVFYDAPQGNISVFFDNYNGPYRTDRVENRLTVSFDALEQATNITISIQ